MKDDGEDEFVKTHTDCLISVAYTGSDWEGGKQAVSQTEEDEDKRKENEGGC